MKQGVLPLTGSVYATARRDDCVQSHAAADLMNKTGAVQKQAVEVLKALKLHGASSAKLLDTIMPVANEEWDGWAHRRMSDLDQLGLVNRHGSGKHRICRITQNGIDFLRSLKK